MGVTVQQVYVEDYSGKQTIRFILLDSNGEPVLPVIRYLKYLDTIGRKQNTLKSYCYHLKLFYEYLEAYGLELSSMNLELLTKFIGWLRSPYQSIVTKPMRPVKAKRSERTINTIMTCIIGFYEHLDRLNLGDPNITSASKKEASSYIMTYKPFLHHITKGKNIDKRVLKVKEPRRGIKVLRKSQVQLINDSCVNVRDKLLIHILYEGGLRISEALSLSIEDFNISQNKISIKESKSSAGIRDVYVTENTMNLFQDYIYLIHSDEVDTNSVFINLRGKNKGQPLKYWAVRSLIQRLKKKVNIDFTPHMFRHTYATELHNAGVESVVLQKLLGHAQVQTTIQLYVHPSEEVIRNEWLKANPKNINSSGE